MRKLWIISLLITPLFFDVPLAYTFEHIPHLVKLIARAMTLCINPAWLFILGCGMLFIDRMLALCWAGTLGAGLFVVRGLKVAIGRPRPGMLLSHGEWLPHPFSFEATHMSCPSSHTFAIFVAATALGMRFPRHRGWFWGAAALLSLSRVVLDRHYLSDVALAAVLGILGTKKIGQVIPARLKH